MRRPLLSYLHLRVGWRLFWKQVFSLFTNPVFLILTLIGNAIMVGGAALFYLIEGNHEKTFIDSLWWSVATVTTVGYGDIIPQTFLGKILGILLMLAGTAIFAGFTGLFASALIAPEVDEIDTEIRELNERLNEASHRKK